MSNYYTKNKHSNENVRRNYLRRKNIRSQNVLISSIESALDEDENSDCGPSIETSSVIGEDPEQLHWDVSSVSDADSDVHILMSESSSSESTNSEDDCDTRFKDSSLFPGCKITRQQSLNLVSALSVRHNFTKAATSDVLKLLHLHFPDQISYPSSHFKFQKCLNLHSENWASIEYYCPTCTAMLTDQKTCPICYFVFSTTDLVSRGNFFLIFDIRKQFQTLLSDYRIRANLTQFFKARNKSDEISDISKGFAYKNLNKGMYDLTCTFNMDGIPLFKSSNSSMWPFLIAINELPFFIRKYVILLGGLWAGLSKPNIQLYIRALINTLNNLNVLPIRWETSDGRTVESKVYFVMAAVDAPARALMQGHTQFNGKFGCTWCCHPGKVIKKGRGHSRIYLSQNSEITQRTNLAYKQQVSEANYTTGLKYASPLNLLRCFDMVDGFSTDYMHCVLLGVTRSFTKMWFENAESNFYIGNTVKAVDNVLKNVRVPYEITRTIRSITTRRHWKASEWRVWLLICPIILKDVLGKSLLKHFSKLSVAIHSLLSLSLNDSILETAKTNLSNFVKDTKCLYGEEFCTYNLHQLTHLVNCVRNWGPLWGTSAFQFESFNGKLLKYVKSSKGVSNQVKSHYLAEMQVRSISNIFEEKSEALNFFQSILKVPTQKRETYSLKRPKIISLKKISVREQLKFYCRVKTVYQSESVYIYHQLYNSVSRNSGKRINSVVQLSDNTLGYIQNAYRMECKCTASCNCIKEVLVVKSFCVKVLKRLPYCFYCPQSNISFVLEVIPLKRVLLKKFIVVETDHRKYFVSLPNLFEAE